MGWRVKYGVGALHIERSCARVLAMDVVALTAPAMALHDTGPNHPESPARLDALMAGLHASSASVAVSSPRRASRDELTAVHDAAYVDLIERFCAAGGGELDTDTHVTPASWEAALLSAGSGLDAIAAVRDGTDLAVCAVRPPGHHARSAQAMGFCVFNNVAVAAASLVAAGHRVAIVDWDVHHGNGTQDIFFESSEVLYLSIHEWGPDPIFPTVSFYPGTGWLDEVGAGMGRGTTVNIPLPAASGGEVFRHAITSVVVPAIETFRADWVLVSSGFDAHTADPLAHLNLVADDFMAAAAGLGQLSLPTVLFAEGGYDLAAITESMTGAIDGFAGAQAAAANGGAPQAAWRLIQQARDEAMNSGAIRS